MRLNRYIASASGLSRRAADTAISDGRVRRNGAIATLGEAVEPGDSIKLDDKLLSLPTTFHYLKLHKPVGYVSSREQQGIDPIVYSLLPPKFANLRLAGRLDRDSSGLILLSDDGDFILSMSHPSANKLKTYEVELDHAPTSETLTRLEQGVRLEDGLSHLHVSRATGRRLTVELEEGRNRQIRRTLGALGYGIKRLHRLQIGPYQLGQLAPGAWEEIQV